jgi:hypothetical protein
VTFIVWSGYAVAFLSGATLGVFVGKRLARHL